MHRGVVVLCLLAAVACVAAALAGASRSTYPGVNGRLAFAVLGSNVDIHSVTANGLETKRLTSAKAFDACPSWSRDGRTIAYCSDASGSYEIWTMRADGSGRHRETDLRSNATFPDISPDGRKIVFSDCAKTCRVMVVDRATGKTSVLVDDERADDTDPVWSPNGKLIAFMRLPRGDVAQVFVARADGSGVRRLTTDRNAKGPFGPDWKPDGTLLAYASRGDIWTLDLGGRTRRITRAKAPEYAPAWSPDGSRIAHLRGSGGDRRVYVMRADGSDARAVSALPGRHLAPSWQPIAR